MRRVLFSFLAAEGGATAIEYALICAFVALVIITGVTSVGLALSDVFNGVAAAF